ncbi:hypothetical protein [Mangrovihabitans endophyticus]|nr:hypothetical protein [Mangrovihabitans endophyticus]
MVAAPAWSAGADGNPVHNPSFDEGWKDSKLVCWNVSPEDSAKLTVTKNAHSGAWAGYAAGRLSGSSELVLSSDRTDDCTIDVAAGGSYALDFWERSTRGARPVVNAYSQSKGWFRWFTGSTIAASSELRRYAFALPVVPSGVSQVSVGVAFPGDGVVVLDDVSMSRLDRLVSEFRPAIGSDGLITNEYAYWNPTKSDRVESPVWEMTSGSLFARNGAGYTGKLDGDSPDALSLRRTGSAVFRLNSRDHSFGDVAVSMDLNITGMTTTSRTPAVDWDGVHLFLRYQSQYELYYASVARRDGHVVLKKKCLGGPSNGGSYYALPGSETSGRAFPTKSWHQIGATIRTNADGSVTITLVRDGRTIAKSTDTGIGCAPITAPGATGIRGDNTEFDFRNFAVTKLG